MTQELGKLMSQAPIKMESLMQESKQKMTKHEKRRAEREYKNEKETVGTHGIYNGRGRPRTVGVSNYQSYPNNQRNNSPSSLPPRLPSRNEYNYTYSYIVLTVSILRNLYFIH